MEGIAAGTIIAGKYRLDRPLAQGGMGAVWAAFDTGLEVPVAVKFMAAALAGSAELVGRFEREAKAAAQLRSPHVVQVFEHGVDRGVPYIVMERLEGEDLGTRLKQRGRLSPWEAAVILEQVCKALRKAHDAGIVHRDLKPANIFLARHDDDEVVKVLDFGIAKSAQSSSGDATRTGVVMGSPSYMSPEQARSTKAVDHRSDLWSLGLVMFRVVTGKMAFSGETDADIIVKLCVDPVPVPSRIAPDLPPEVDAWFARALSRDLDQRFQSAREMATTFGRIVGRVPSLGEPTTGASVAAVAVAAVAEVPAAPQAAEATSSDVAQTVRLEAQGLHALRKTLPLPTAKVAEVTAPLLASAPVEVTGPLPEVAVPANGATLTNAGSETAAESVTGSRGWMVWGLLGGAGAAAVVTAGLFAMRGTGVSGAPGRPSAVVAAMSTGSAVAATASAVPEAMADAGPEVTATAEASASAAAPSVSATAPAAVAAATGVPKVGKSLGKAGKAPGGSAPVSAPPGGEDGLDIPRVVGKGK